MKRNWKKVVATLIILVLAVSLVLVGCSANKTSQNTGSTPDKQNNEKSAGNAKQDAKVLPVMGHTLKYDPNVPVNGGKDITIKFWDWTNHEKYDKKWTAEYSKIHPNVKWEITTSAYDDYFKKLPVALQSGTGPDIFAMHNQFTDVLVPNMEPYPENVLPLDELRADFRQVDAHLINGKLYYLDYGLMTSGIFYNKKLWKEAGLTDADIPKTWEQFKNVAKKLTKYDASGNITVAGFNMNTYMQYLWQAMQYQQGRFLFSPDGKRAVINTPEGKKAAQWLYDLYNVEKVGSIKFPEMGQAFGNGQAAMVYSWAWLGDFINQNFPNIEWGYFPLPTFDGNTPPAYERNNGESTPGVSAKADEAHKAVAFDYIKYLLANDDALVDIDTGFLIAPSKFALDSRPEIANHPIISIEAKMLDRTVWPGPAPDPYYTGLIKYLGDAILVNNVPVDEALSKAEQIINKDLQQTGFVSVERSYKYANELK